MKRDFCLYLGQQKAAAEVRSVTRRKTGASVKRGPER